MTKFKSIAVPWLFVSDTLSLAYHRRLELERTINSMSLAAEREILKKIHKLNLTRRQVNELVLHDQRVQARKTTVTTLRETLKEQQAEISDIKLELATVSTAVTLGCEVKDLQCKKIDCPSERIGAVIGKKGKHVQKLKSTANVDVDIVRGDSNTIHLVGTSDSLDVAVSNLDKVISEVERTIALSDAAQKYLTSAKITLQSEWRERYPNVYFNINRPKKETEPSSPNPAVISTMQVRGSPSDVNAMERKILELEVVESDLHLSARDSGLLVGKAGSTIVSLVETYQAGIEVQRPKKSEKESRKSENKNELTRVTVFGPSEKVSQAIAAIQEMVETNKDHDATIEISPMVKIILLLTNGAGIQSIRKKASEAMKSLEGGAASNSVAINLNETTLTIKGTANALQCAFDVVNAEIASIQSNLIQIDVDPFIIPVIVGKGGQGIKDLKEGTISVFIDVDRETNCLSICGLQQEEVKNVEASVRAFIGDNHVHRIALGSDEIGSSSSFALLYSNLSRSKNFKEARELAFILADESKNEVVLRGKQEDVLKASTVIQQCLAANFIDEFVVSEEDISALLSGGQGSKIAEIANIAEVNISIDRERNAVIAKGEKVKVRDSIKSLRGFLYGSSDVVVSKVEVASSELLGLIIGKGGKTVADLQKKHPVSILVHRKENVVTLRGQKDHVEECRVEIMKLVLGANISKTMTLSDTQMAKINKPKVIRQITQQSSVQITPSPEKNNIAFRGLSSDVFMAMALVKEQLEDVYEGRMHLGLQLFKKVEEACRSSSHLQRIEEQSNAKIHLDGQGGDLVASGKRQSVRAAKLGLLTFVDFLVGPQFSQCDVPPSMIQLFKSASIVEIAAKTGAQVNVDRDLSSILVFAVDVSQVESASEMINKLITGKEDLAFVWKFTPSENWLVSNLIGKNGETLKRLRKQSGCSIEVDSVEKRAILSAETSELAAKGKAILDEFVETSRRECCFVILPENDIPAFLGRSGANIKKFAETHSVDIQLEKSAGSAVRIVGKEANVSNAKTAVEAWLASRIETLNDAKGEVSKLLKSSNIPVLIGSKGATIRGLEREFGCKIDVDRRSSTVTVKGGSTARRVALLEKMDRIFSEKAGDAKDSTKTEGENCDSDSAKENILKQMSDDCELHESQDLDEPNSANSSDVSSPQLQDGSITFIGDVFEEQCDFVETAFEKMD